MTTIVPWLLTKAMKANHVGSAIQTCKPDGCEGDGNCTCPVRSRPTFISFTLSDRRYQYSARVRLRETTCPCGSLGAEAHALNRERNNFCFTTLEPRHGESARTWQP